MVGLVVSNFNKTSYINMKFQLVGHDFKNS